MRGYDRAARLNPERLLVSPGAAVLDIIPLWRG
jgi:hypothetical protein